MEHHPLTPMTDANLVRVLGRQTDGTVGLVPYATVERGCRRHPRRHDGIEGARPALCDRRCGERRASAGDRRSGGRACADHRRIRRRDGAAGEFPSRGIAAGARRCRRVAACRRPRRRASPVRVRARHWHNLATRVGQLPVWQLDPLATPDARQACGGRTGLGARQAGRHADRHRRIGAAGQGCRRAGEARTRCRRCADRSRLGANRRGHRRTARVAWS